MIYIIIYFLIIAVVAYYGVHKQIVDMVENPKRKDIQKRMSIIIFSVLLIIFTLVRMMFDIYMLLIYYLR